jgi:hypothetical protein
VVGVLVGFFVVGGVGFLVGAAVGTEVDIVHSIPRAKPVNGPLVG